MNNDWAAKGYTIDNTPNTKGNSIFGTSGKASKTCDHDYDSLVTTEPTCVAEGIKTFTCTKCGKSYTESIPATGEHKYSSDVTKKATCKEEGVTTYTCETCWDSYEKISLTDHEYASVVTEEPASLFTKGKQFTRCIVCGEVIEEIDIPSKASSGVSKIGIFFRNLF